MGGTEPAPSGHTAGPTSLQMGAAHLPSQPQAPDAPPSAPPRAQEPKRLPDRKAERISLRLCPRLPGPLLPVRPSPRGLAPLPVVPCGASPLRPLLARALEACSSLGQ